MKGNLKETLRNIRRLAERGAPHERRVAQKMLDRLLLRHNLTVADLDVSEPRPCRFLVRGRQDLTLLLHVACKVKGVAGIDVKRYRGRSKRAVYLDLTDVERAEVSLLYRTYRKALRRDAEILLDAFVIANQILPAGVAEDPPELSPEEMQQLDTTLRMARLLSPVHVPRKRPPRRLLRGGSDARS